MDSVKFSPCSSGMLSFYCKWESKYQNSKKGITIPLNMLNKREKMIRKQKKEMNGNLNNKDFLLMACKA